MELLLSRNLWRFSVGFRKGLAIFARSFAKLRVPLLGSVDLLINLAELTKTPLHSLALDSSREG